MPLSGEALWIPVQPVCAGWPALTDTATSCTGCDMNRTLLIIFFLSLVVLFHTVRSLLPAKVPLGRRYTRHMHTQHKEGAEMTLVVHPEVSLGIAPYPDPKTLLDACVQVLHSTRIADMSFRDHRV